ncbi:FadR/GntR family transcriptional regulator [Roseibium sp. MMSF_3544]|uniref:FadR/GntR family transcriptional regulator n=1 Tax=unclassified Roseibium TaxID=2629323 RepID=UPI00273DC47A|nr:FadR/GntR family transcriptional regulator [Roseibium sp. MMSF_3544]
MLELQAPSIPALDLLRGWLNQSGLRPGGRLPPERELCDTLGVSRGVLRKALTVLEAEGVVHRKVGKGTFLGDAYAIAGATSESLMFLADRTSPHEAMVARLIMEPELTALAAVHATPRHLVRLRELTQEMRAATSWPSYEELDFAFHTEIAEAAGNTLLSELHWLVNKVRVSVVWSRLDVPEGGPPADYHSFTEHEAIVAALERRDVTGAKNAMRAHLKSVRATFLPED